MSNENSVTIYHYKFVNGAYKCTPMEAVETTAQYKLKKDSGAPSYRVVIKKVELDKITRSYTTYEMFSAEYNPKKFSMLLLDIYRSNITLLQQQIKQLEKEVMIITTIS